ncbi:PrpF domain-containing protein [Collinsella sp. An271]|uniref:PrpF domain-containing protein n=1 Tax=Collinsella sp. An271 TaxID=1965616 RepID=UPI0031B86639
MHRRHGTHRPEDGDVRAGRGLLGRGVDGTAAELLVKFLDPAGTKTGALLPTGQVRDTLEIPELGPIEATILDVSNPLVVVRASDLGLAGTELPAEVDANERASRLLEAIRGAAAVKMGFASDLADATANSPAVPKVGFVTAPTNFTDIAGRCVEAGAMDICARVISVFKCHKACPLTASSAISVAAMLEGSIVHKVMAAGQPADGMVRIGHPSGVMTMKPELVQRPDGTIAVPSVAVQRTARRIMDGTVYIRD